MVRPPIALLAFVLAATACGGGADTTSGDRVKLSDLGLGRGGGDRRFHGTCPSGRLTVDFRPGDEITIRIKDRLVASLSAEEALISCSDAQVEARRSGQGSLFKQFAPNRKQPTKLSCVAAERLDISVQPVYEFEAQLIGGEIIVSTPRRSAGRLALLAASFRESGESRVTYHTPRCRVSGGS